MLQVALLLHGVVAEQRVDEGLAGAIRCRLQGLRQREAPQQRQHAVC